MSNPHPSHKIRGSDASSFDYICELCGATDKVPGGWAGLMSPCSKAKSESLNLTEREQSVKEAKELAKWHEEQSEYHSSRGAYSTSEHHKAEAIIIHRLLSLIKIECPVSQAIRVVEVKYK